MRVLIRGVLAMVIGFAASFGASAQEAAPGGEAAAFAKELTEWKSFLKSLAEMQALYQKAEPKDRPAMEKQWKEMMAKGEVKEASLVNAAEKAYAAAPNADPKITELLVNVLKGDVQTDDYDRAIRIARLLMDNKCPDKKVANLAGLAAFAVADFDAAEKYFKQAKKDKTLDPKMAEHELSLIPEYRKLWAEEVKIREKEAKVDDLPRVLFKTSKGDIEIELFENEAPNTVANFISLVEKGFYDGTKFHRVLANFMAQGGDPTGTGTSGPGYTIACECYKPEARKHFRGSLSMAHAGRDTGGSQFFLTFLPTDHLNGKHTVFGRVVKGWEVLTKLQRVDPNRPGPKPDLIVKAEVIRKRPHAYKPTTAKE